MGRYFKTSWCVFLGVIVSMVTIVSCNEDDLTDESFTIGDDLVESTTRVVYTDTISVSTSTVILDSVVTSGNNIAQVGHYKDEYFGDITAKSYLQLGLSDETLDNDIDYVYDSLRLILHYTGDSYGDTLQEQTLYVYQLDERLDSDEETIIDYYEDDDYDTDDDADYYLYNTTSFKYSESGLLGKLTYTPQPNYKDQLDPYYTADSNYLEIPLDDELGKELFDKLIDGDDYDFEDDDHFAEYFKGLALVAENSGDNGAIVEFNAADSGIYMCLYYHYGKATDHKDLKSEFFITDDDLQYNQITCDRTGTPLENWETRKIDLPSSETDNKTFIQGSLGVFTRIEFPGLDYFIHEGDNAVILAANLDLHPIKKTYEEFPLSTNLALFSSESFNRVGGRLYDASGSSYELGSIYLDDDYNLDTYIRFDLTNYLISDLMDGYHDEDFGFLCGLNYPDFNSSLDRVVLGGNEDEDFKPVLKIYYLLYE